MSHALTQDQIIREENKRYHTFLNIAMALAMITGIEIVIIFIPFAYWVLLTGLTVLSVIKFAFVILWFMHLIYDKMLLFLLFLSGMLLATGTMVALLLLFSPADVDWAEFESRDTITIHSHNGYLG